MFVEKKLRVSPGTIGSTAIEEKFQNPILWFSMSNVHRTKNSLENGTTSTVRMGEFSKSSGGSGKNATTNSAEFFFDQAMDCIRELKGFYNLT